MPAGSSRTVPPARAPQLIPAPRIGCFVCSSHASSAPRVPSCASFAMRSSRIGSSANRWARTPSPTTFARAARSTSPWCVRATQGLHLGGVGTAPTVGALGDACRLATSSAVSSRNTAQEVSSSRAPISSPRWIRTLGRRFRDARRRRELSLHRPGGSLMSVTTHLDAAEVATWLTRVTQTIDRSLREPVRASRDAVADRPRVALAPALPILIQLALLDDCLRVAHQAIEADGQHRCRRAGARRRPRARRCEQVLRGRCPTTRRSPRSADRAGRHRAVPAQRIATMPGRSDSVRARSGAVSSSCGRSRSTPATPPRFASTSGCSRGSWTRCSPGERPTSSARARRDLRELFERQTVVSARSARRRVLSSRWTRGVRVGRTRFADPHARSVRRRVDPRRGPRGLPPPGHPREHARTGPARSRPDAARARRVGCRQDSPAARVACAGPLLAPRLRRLPADDLRGRRLLALRAAQPDRFDGAPVRRARPPRVRADVPVRRSRGRSRRDSARRARAAAHRGARPRPSSMR